MRAGPPDDVARGNLRRSVRVSSWLGGELLAENIPVSMGMFTEDDGQEIPERVELTVPLASRGFDWDPGADTRHPLARFGQRLYVVIDVFSPSTGESWEIPLGWFQIQSWRVADDESSIAVTATGLLQVVADDSFRVAVQPKAGGTFASEFRRLVTGGIPVDVSELLQDRACPGSLTWDEDRLGALYDLADAWPARLLTAAEGSLQVLPPLGSAHTPVVTLTDGEAGVLMSAPRDANREGVFNTVVATSSADDAGSTPVSAQYMTHSGPYAVAEYGVVRTRYASPLLGSVEACLAAAQTIAENSQRRGRLIKVQMPPDPRLQRGDAVTLVWDGVTYRGWVQAARLPLTATGGPGEVTIGVSL